MNLEQLIIHGFLFFMFFIIGYKIGDNTNEQINKQKHTISDTELDRMIKELEQ